MHDDEDRIPPRPMDPAESWKAMFRHHKVTEIEADMLRARCEFFENALDTLNKNFGIRISQPPPMPPKTPILNWHTYRMQDGKFPSDVLNHLDWLSKEDFDALAKGRPSRTRR